MERPWRLELWNGDGRRLRAREHLVKKGGQDVCDCKRLGKKGTRENPAEKGTRSKPASQRTKKGMKLHGAVGKGGKKMSHERAHKERSSDQRNNQSKKTGYWQGRG